MTTKNKKRSLIPLLLTLVIGLFILFLAWAARQASTSGTDITDRDYYSKGLRYNSTMVEKRAASVIGWQLRSRLEEGKLMLLLRDRDLAPVSGANGRLIPGNKVSGALQLRETSPGHYQVRLPESLRGEQTVRIEFERLGARISRQLLLTINR